MDTAPLRWAAIAALFLTTASAFAEVHAASAPRSRRVRVLRRGHHGPPPPVYVSPRYLSFGVRWRAVPRTPPAYSQTESVEEQYAPPPPQRSAPSNPAATGVLVGELSGYGRAGSLGVFAAVEGKQLGVSLAATGYSLWAPSWNTAWSSPSSLYPYGRFGTLNANLTLALLSTDKFRWRIHGGGEAAFFPDTAMLGPSVGTSFVAQVAGPFGLEASADLTPLPFHKAELRAGAWLNTGALLVRLGWRTVMLSDAGLIDGVVRRDFFTGPVLGLGVAF